jgi:multicomponent Na+:H+ antiporter subunit G
VTTALAIWIADTLIVFAALMNTVSVYGLFRMPDVYTQLHSASKGVFLGVMAIVCAAPLVTDEAAILSRGVLIAVFLVLTTPVSAHVIARAARLAGEPMRTPGAVDETASTGSPPKARDGRSAEWECEELGRWSS